MAEVDLIQDIKITTDFVSIKFNRTLAIADIDNEDFVVEKVTPPTVLTDPFETIDIDTHYNAVSRTIVLYWSSGALEASTDYTLTVTGLTDVTGATIDDEVCAFTSSSTIVDDPDTPPTDTEFEVTDKSLDADAIISAGFSTGINSDFYVLSTDPEDGSYYLEEDYKNGRITIKFSNRADNEFVSSEYFQVQRKLVQRAPARWEMLSALIYQDGSRPWVYIDLPSIDHFPEAATPSSVIVYGEEGYEYYEPGYKYRIVVSGDVST